MCRANYLVYIYSIVGNEITNSQNQGLFKEDLTIEDSEHCTVSVTFNVNIIPISANLEPLRVMTQSTQIE